MGSRTEIAAALAGHIVRNRELVALIEKRGGDLSLTRTIDLHFWATSEAGAEVLASTLAGEGLRNVTVASPTDDSDAWSVEGQLESSVAAVVEHSFVKRFVKLAASRNAEFDGWGTHLGG